MTRLPRWFVHTCSVVALTTSTSWAATLELRSGRDLSRLPVGEPTVISASITGLEETSSLDSLFVGITYDVGLVEVTAVTPGTIVPSQLAEPEDFLGSAEAGIVDVAFSTFSSDPAHQIVSSGRFFDFQIRGLAEGTGALTIDFVLGTLFNPADPGSPIDLAIDRGTPLNVTVIPIPEPGTATLLASALLACVFYRMSRSVVAVAH